MSLSALYKDLEKPLIIHSLWPRIFWRGFTDIKSIRLMKILNRGLLMLLLLQAFTGISKAEDYGLPSEIQNGNILHCFNWSPSEIKGELQAIASAGFGSVQLSPLQRPDIRTGSSWHDLYRPYDLAFKSSSFCSEEDLRSLCAEAEKYGIKVIVDIVANHVDKTSGYHDTWWDSGNRVRWEGGIDYSSRYSITHGQLGDYGDVNSELQEVCSRAKAYVEKLKSLGVKGIRWDAAKHIGLPSENCGFWTAVTSVPDMYHYGEILDSPGPDASIIKEYTRYMSVTDNRYCNFAARNNGGIPGGYGGDWAVNQNVDDSRLVYWAESHDTYSNDEWSQNVDQSVIDRAYAAFASRNGAACLYLSRPNSKGFSNIKIGKGSTAFKNRHVAEVNKFRNAMTGRKDWFSSTGNACSITRENGGAVIVMRGSGNVSVPNGGSYCPPGTYTDRVGGGSFTVTASTISGTVGNSGIAVIYADGTQPPVNPPVDPPVIDELPYINGVYLDNTQGWAAPSVWAWTETVNCTASGTWPGDRMTKVKDYYWKWEVPDGRPVPEKIIFSYNGDDNKTADLIYVTGGVYDCSGKLLTTLSGGDPVNPPGGDGFTIYYDNSATGWSAVRIHHWNTPATEWPGLEMTKFKGDVWSYTFKTDPSGLKGFLFNNGIGSGDANQTADFNGAPKPGHIYKGSGGNKGQVVDCGLYGENPPGGVIELEDLDETVVPEYYSLEGLRIRKPAKGVFIVRRANKVTREIVR